MRTRAEQKPPIDIEGLAEQNEQLKLQLQDAEHTLELLKKDEDDNAGEVVTLSFRERPQLFLISPVWLLTSRMFLL